MTAASPSPRGSLVAPMLALLAPVISLGAVLFASDGDPLRLVQEAGGFAFLAIGASFVVAFATAALLFVASRGSQRVAAVAALLVLVPWALMALAEVLGAGLVAAAVGGADPQSKLAILSMGTSEVMSCRILGAAFLLGSSVAFSAAMFALAVSPSREADVPAVPGGVLASLVWLAVAVCAGAVMADAVVLRHGLAAASQAGAATPVDVPALVAVLTETLSDARDTDNALVGAVAFTVFAGVALLGVALRQGATGSALVVFGTCLVGVVFGVVDVCLVYYVAATLENPAPWADEAFDPIASNGPEGAAGSVPCLATFAGVDCQGRRGDYDGLDGVLPSPDASQSSSLPSLGRGVTLAGVPALTVAIDTQLPARQLRQLLLAATAAGYRSLQVVGAWTAAPFLDDRDEREVPPLLEVHRVVPVIHSTWLLTLAVGEGGDGLQPIVIEVLDEDTAGSVAARASAVTDQSVLVVPAALPRVAPPAPPADVAPLGLTGVGSASDTASATLDPAGISRVVRANVNRVRACFERGLRENPDLGGRVMMRFTIAPTGAVTEATASPTLADPTALRCMEAAVREFTFPADPAREPVTVNYPFIFNTSP